MSEPTEDKPKMQVRGIHCPSCQGRRLAACYTRHRPGATIRVRKCTACGHRIRTAERFESMNA